MKKSILIGIIAVIILLAVLLVITVIHTKQNIANEPDMVNSYRQITQDEARKMMKQNDGHIVVDVRRPDEFETGHIPGAICIPNEGIDAEPPEELPDLDQIILIYCRSGRRSKEAAQKLFDMGYSRVYEFGGILDWTGETVTEQPSGAEQGEMST